MAAPESIDFTTDASGDAVVYLPSARGAVWHLSYLPGAATPDAGTLLTVEGEDSGIVLLSAVNVGATRKDYSPRLPTHGTDGAALLHYALGSGVGTPYRTSGKERLKVTIASGGAAKTGSVQAIYE